MYNDIIGHRSVADMPVVDATRPLYTDHLAPHGSNQIDFIGEPTISDHRVRDAFQSPLHALDPEVIPHLLA